LRIQVEYVASVKATKSSAQAKKRLRAQATYQASHVVAVRATESSAQIKERLKAQANYVANVKAS